MIATWTASAVEPLTVAVPLLAAALLAASQPLRRRLIAETIALIAVIATVALCVLVTISAGRHGELVYWFGGWRPVHGVVVGIDFAADPLAGGLAAFAGVLTGVALIFSWRHFETVGHAFPALLLVLLAAMVAFCESGDLFDMFVFFELMTVVAIALTAYRSDERAPLQGALGFGVCNAIGGFLVLFGIAILYGRTGTLNLAEIAQVLHRRPADDLIVCSFGLIATGFLVKAAIVPFHFWLADAYASAPTPVCVVFAGVMSEMGLFGLARVYETVFAPTLAPGADALRLTLVVTGSITALGGAAMCLLQDHAKRVLAFATISSMGVFLIGFGTLATTGLAGATIDVVSGGLIKAGLFVCIGVLQHRRADSESPGLRGAGRDLPVIGLTFLVGALALAGVPGAGPFLARGLIEHGADEHSGLAWVAFVIAVAETVTAAGVLAVAARAFLGRGPDLPGDAGEGDDPEDVPIRDEPPPALLAVPAIVLVLGGVAVGAVPGVRRLAMAAADRFASGAALDRAVLTGRTRPALASTSAPASASVTSVLVAVGLTVVAIAIAGLIAVPRRAPRRPVLLADIVRRSVHTADALHSGRVGDYVTWLAAGAAALCATLLLVMR